MSNLVTSNLVPEPLWPQKHKQLPGGNSDARCGRDWRPTSSFYIDDHMVAQIHNQNTAMYSYTTDMGSGVEPVSPPSSPEMYADYNEYMDYDVSPIDEEPDMFQRHLTQNPPQPPPAPIHAPAVENRVQPQSQSRQRQQSQPTLSSTDTGSAQQAKSSIPTMRRERRKQRDAAHAQANKDHRQSPRAQDTATFAPQDHAQGWEDPSGQSSSPSPTAGFRPDTGPRYGSTTTITSQPTKSRSSNNPAASFGQRMRQLGRGMPEPIENRPAWNGASGRQVQVDPVRDNLGAAPLKIPPKSTKRAERAKSPQTLPSSNPSLGPSAAAAAAVRKLMPVKSGQAPAKASTSHLVAETAKQGVPIQTQPRSSPPNTETSSTAAREPLSSSPASSVPARLNIPRFDQSIKRKPSPMTNSTTRPQHSHHQSWSSSVYSDMTITPQTQTGTAPAPLQISEPFGAQSQEESSPETPEAPPLESEPAISVMDRKRPVPGRNSPPSGAVDDAIVISLKSANLSKTVDGQIQNSGKPDRPLSLVSTAKALPPAPPELVEPQDRIAVLNARIDGLAHRRLNVTKSIQQMTELMPKDTLIISAEVQRKREEEKRKVEILKEELADIQQQEYKLGLKLHRAYRRQDREAEYETGTLWVRRVTS